MKRRLCKQRTFYFPKEMIAELQAEAERQDRSLSWIVEKAWRIAREQIQHLKVGRAA